VLTQCQGGKTLAMILEKHFFFTVNQSEKGYKISSKRFGVHRFTERKIIYNWKTFKTVANFPRSACPSEKSWLVLGGLPDEIPFSLEITWQHSLGWQSYI